LYLQLTTKPLLCGVYLDYVTQIWNNSQIWHGDKKLEFELPDGALVTEADEILKAETGINIVKSPYISLQITKIKTQWKPITEQP